MRRAVHTTKTGDEIDEEIEAKFFQKKWAKFDEEKRIEIQLKSASKDRRRRSRSRSATQDSASARHNKKYKREPGTTPLVSGDER